MSTKAFLRMTLGDQFAEFETCVERFALAIAKPAPSWSELRDIGHRACFLSQCFLSDIADKRRRRDMPCTQGSELLERFTRTAREVLARSEAPEQTQYQNL